MAKVLDKPNVLRALTGLNTAEFNQLVDSFSKEWNNHLRKNWLGQARQRAPGAGPKAALESIELKLLFILVHFRLYPIQEVLGFLFGMKQPQANRWIMRLTPLLKKALGRELVLPARQPYRLEQVLSECPELQFVLDGTDRPIRRPKNKQRKKDHYSGRKKRHTVKNLILTQGKKVKFLSKTVPGKHHDKAIAEKIERFPAQSLVLADSGFKGFAPEGAVVITPAKKPRNGELHPATVQSNKVLAQCRVGVEHVISGIKRCRIVADVLRHLKRGFADQVMEIACGLHNLRQEFRAAA